MPAGAKKDAARRDTGSGLREELLAQACEDLEDLPSQDSASAPHACGNAAVGNLQV